MTQTDAHGHEYTRDGGVKGKERLTIAGVAKLWPTPDTMCGLTFKSQKTMTRQANTVRKGRTQTSNLRDQVAVEEGIRYWPTPQSRDYRTGEGHRWKTPEKRSRNLNDAIAYKEGHRMFPTPTQRDHKGAKRPEILEKEGRNPMTNSLGDAIEEGATNGQLNPPWVEWLMGYPRNWTVEGEITAHDGFDSEPSNTPRVAIDIPDRVKRLKALGNAVVPQIPEILGRMIMEIEND